MADLVKGATLLPRDRDVLILRLGLGPDGRVWTQQEVGALMGITRFRVMQLEKRAFKTLGLTGIEIQVRTRDDNNGVPKRAAIAIQENREYVVTGDAVGTVGEWIRKLLGAKVEAHKDPEPKPYKDLDSVNGEPNIGDLARAMAKGPKVS